MDNNSKHTDQINLSDIDWNKLSPSEFSALEHKMQEKQKIVKASKRKKTRSTGFVTVKIKGNNYSIKETLYQRLSTLRSEKSKQKLIDEIISSHNPIAKI